MRVPDVTETLTLSGGALGLVPPCSLDVRPFTVLIGKQGSGKSLLAQALYFFRDLPFLVSYDAASHDPLEPMGEPAGDAAESIVQRILDSVRSSRRAFAVFATPAVTLHWEEQRGPDRTTSLRLTRRREPARAP